MIDDWLRWADYIQQSLVETAIGKDILLLHRVEKPALLRQLYALSCDYAGLIVSYQKLLGQLQDAGNTTTLAHYQHLKEVDFVLKKGHRLVALEVKTSSVGKPHTGLAQFQKNWPETMSWIMRSDGLDLADFLNSDLTYFFA